MTIKINKKVVMGTQLTYFDRQQIEHYLRLDWNVCRIAKRIVKDHSVVSREITRNRSLHLPNEAQAAQKMAEARDHLLSGKEDAQISKRSRKYLRCKNQHWNIRGLSLVCK